MSKMLLFAGRPRALGERVASHLEIALTPLEITRFPGGEEKIQLGLSVSGCTVVFVHTTSGAENFVLSLQMMEAATRADAGKIVLVDPFMGYQRQEKTSKGKPRESVTARIVAESLQHFGLDRYFVVDPHNDGILSLFKNASPMYAGRLFVDWFRQQNYPNPVIVTPDAGGMPRALWYSDQLGVQFAQIQKRRDPGDGKLKVYNVVGDIGPENVAVIVDDVLSTGRTLLQAMDVLSAKRGVTRFIIIATHAELCGDAIERLNASGAERIVVTDTIEHPPERLAKMIGPGGKFVIIPIAEWIARAIRSLQKEGESVSKLSD